MPKKRVMFISSTGGHLSELLKLSPLFVKYDYSIITEKTITNLSLKEKHKKVGFLIFGTQNNMLLYILKLFCNCWISLFYFIKFRPKIIITTGSHTVGPMCCIGKLFGSKIIYIESFANINSMSRCGRIIYKFADLFIVQWEDMLEFYPKAKFVGGIF